MRSAFAVVRLYRRCVFATASGPIALGAMVKSFLRRNDVRLLATPDFKGRLLNGSPEGEGQCPGKARFVPHTHRIETGGGKFTGLAT
jgi:hypothetical protein